MDMYIGCDSAWTDSRTAPGAICAAEFTGRKAGRFHTPTLATFGTATGFVDSIRSPDGVTLIALDQSTVVPNVTGMRPVEGLSSQPSVRQKTEASREARTAVFLMEVFPALALASFGAASFGRRRGPRYNPARRKTFRFEDWVAVCGAAQLEAQSLRADAVADWCEASGRVLHPSKADQDRLDSVLCLLVALRWRLGARNESIMLGDRTSRYMVFPASQNVRDYLLNRAGRLGVAVDGVITDLANNPFIANRSTRF